MNQLPVNPPNPDEWRTPQFRERLVQQMERILQGTTSSNISARDIEAKIFAQATDREQYIAFLRKFASKIPHQSQQQQQQQQQQAGAVNQGGTTPAQSQHQQMFSSEMQQQQWAVAGGVASGQGIIRQPDQFNIPQHQQVQLQYQRQQQYQQHQQQLQNQQEQYQTQAQQVSQQSGQFPQQLQQQQQQYQHLLMTSGLGIQQQTMQPTQPTRQQQARSELPELRRHEGDVLTAWRAEIPLDLQREISSQPSEFVIVLDRDMHPEGKVAGAQFIYLCCGLGKVAPPVSVAVAPPIDVAVPKNYPEIWIDFKEMDVSAYEETEELRSVKNKLREILVSQGAEHGCSLTTVLKSWRDAVDFFLQRL